MEDSFGNIFVNCIFANIAGWIIYFIWSFLKVKLIEHKKIILSLGEITMWILLAASSSAFGILTTFIVVFVFICGILSKVAEYFSEHCLDKISDFFHRKITI